MSKASHFWSNNGFHCTRHTMLPPTNPLPGSQWPPAQIPDSLRPLWRSFPLDLVRNYLASLASDSVCCLRHPASVWISQTGHLVRSKRNLFKALVARAASYRQSFGARTHLGVTSSSSVPSPLLLGPNTLPSWVVTPIHQRYATCTLNPTLNNSSLLHLVALENVPHTGHEGRVDHAP